MDRKVTPDQLAEHDGQGGRPAWVAYRGKVYDASSSRLWARGTHMKGHQAGRDLTGELPAAPHDESVLQRLPVVGILAGGQQQELPRLIRMYLDLHPHPVSVHFPIALTLAAAAFLVACLAGRMETLADSAYYTLLGAVAMAPVSALTGASSWWFNYGRRLTGTFAAKAGLSALYFVTGVVTAVLWALNREAVADREAMAWVCLALVGVMSAAVLALGHLGGGLVFPPRRKPGRKA